MIIVKQYICNIHYINILIESLSCKVCFVFVYIVNITYIVYIIVLCIIYYLLFILLFLLYEYSTCAKISEWWSMSKTIDPRDTFTLIFLRRTPI